MGPRVFVAIQLQPLVLGWLLLGRFASGADPAVDPAASDVADLSLEDLASATVRTVSSVSKYEQDIHRAPASTTTITAEEIRGYGHRTLADVLASVNGLYVTYDRTYAYLGARGFNRPGDYTSHVLVLIDGHRINDSFYDGAVLGTDALIDVDNIERVEVVRGPSFSVYGNNAVFGVVNIITRRGRDVTHGEVSAEAGSYGTYKGLFTTGHRFANDLEFLLSGSIYDSAGPRRYYSPYQDALTPDVADGVATDMDSDRAYRTLGSLSWHGLSLEGAFAYRDKVYPTAPYGVRFNDPRTRVVDRPSFLEAKYVTSWEPDWSLTTRAYWDDYAFRGYYPYESALNFDSEEGSRVGAEIQATKVIADRHTVIAGVEFIDGYRAVLHNYDIEPYTLYLDEQHDRINWSVYAQGDWQLATNLFFTTGVRYDAYQTVGDTVNPRLGLVWSPWTGTTLKGLYGNAFRAPNIYEMYWNDDGFSSKPNPGLKSESIRSYEFVWEQELTKQWSFASSAFLYQMDDLIGQVIDTDDLLIYQNTGQVFGRGLEFELRGRWAGGLQTRLSYTLQRIEFEETGAELSNSPRHLGKLNLLLPLWRDHLFSGLEFQYVGQMAREHGGRTDDYFLMNWTLYSRELVRNLDLSVSLYNLFDQKFSHPVGSEIADAEVPQDGFTFRVKATYRF